MGGFKRELKCSFYYLFGRKKDTVPPRKSVYHNCVFRKLYKDRCPNIVAKSQPRLHSPNLMKYSTSAAYFSPHILININPTREVQKLID